MQRRILIIDDHPDTADTMAELLRMMGHEVHAALDAHMGFSMASVFRPDVVFVDMKLGQEDGCHLTWRMKTQLGLKSRFYAMTGHPGEYTQQHAMHAGCDAYFLKPLDPGMFESLLAA